MPEFRGEKGCRRATKACSKGMPQWRAAKARHKGVQQRSATKAYHKGVLQRRDPNFGMIWGLGGICQKFGLNKGVGGFQNFGVYSRGYARILR